MRRAARHGSVVCLDLMISMMVFMKMPSLSIEGIFAGAPSTLIINLLDHSMVGCDMTLAK